MSNTFKNSLIKGTLILTIAGIIARILGFYNRIFLCNLFGERELGIFQMILPIYMVVFSFCCQGIQTALTRHIAKAKSESLEIRCNFLLIAILISVILSIVCGILISSFSNLISIKLLHTPECANCLRILCIAFPFVTVKGCIIGYFLGNQSSGPTAFGQLIEQIFKIGSVFILFQFIVTNKPTASFAVFGVICGEIGSCLFMLICLGFYLKKEHVVQASSTILSNQPSNRSIAILLLKDAIPLTTNRLSLTAFQSIEAILIPQMLTRYLSNNDYALILYGTLSGLVIPCMMFPTTLTNSLATMLLPAISGEFEKHAYESIIRLTKRSIIFCLFIGLASTIYLLIFGKWTGSVLLSSQNAGELLFQFAFLCPFIFLSSSLASIMNGIGKSTSNMIFSIIGSCIRIIFILVLVPILGLQGYFYGLMTSYIIQTIILIIFIQKSIKPKHT